MSAIDQFIIQARYNQLMNQRQYDACALLTKAQLDEDRGAFFKSILGTLNHIMVGDIVWLKRFSDHSLCRESLSWFADQARPSKLTSILFEDLNALRQQREFIDALIIAWLADTNEEMFSEPLQYRDMAGDRYEKTLKNLLTHLFLHQVHHRGQVTVLLSQSGVDFGETDLLEII